MRWMHRLAAGMLTASLAACSAPGFAPTGVDVPAARLTSAGNANDANPGYAFAPYVDMSSWPPFSFAKNSAQTGTLYYTMAFVQSYQGTNGATCQGAWGTSVLPSDPANGPYFSQQLAAIRKRGGDGIVSFGGAYGTELAEVCPDVPSLEAAYEAVVDYYGFTHLDFDIEGADTYDASALQRRSQALAALQAHYASLGKRIAISYTLPVLPQGFPPGVLEVVKAAMAARVKIDIVNVMTMDFGDANAPHPAGWMGRYAIASVKSAVRQLRRIGFPLRSNPYGSLGVTPMIGQNDVGTEVFEPADATQLLAWARQAGLGRIAYWAAQRDKACPGGRTTVVSDTCSGIVQKTDTFSRIFAAF